MTTHLGLQRILLPSAQVSQLTTGSITLPSARGQFVLPVEDVFDSIATLEPAQGAGNVTFSSIPQTYRHLMIRGIMKTNDGGVGNGFGAMRFNSDTSSNYTLANGYCNDATELSLAYANFSFAMMGNIPYSGNADRYGIVHLYIPNYRDTTVPKIVFGDYGLEQGGADQSTGNFASVWNSTAAITSITIAHSFFTDNSYNLYGIKGASS
jgi:hypothetical protein